MTAEELLLCLPECNNTVISQMWIPAMHKQFDQIKAMQQEASASKTGSPHDLKSLADVSEVSHNRHFVNIRNRGSRVSVTSYE